MMVFEEIGALASRVNTGRGFQSACTARLGYRWRQIKVSS